MKTGKEQEKVFETFKKKRESRGTLKLVTIRLHEKDIEDLEAIFETKGLNKTSGIRMLVREFLEKEKGL